MPAFQDITEAVAQGLGGASGNQAVVDTIENRKDQRKQLSNQELQANVGLYDKAIAGIQAKMGTVAPGSPEHTQLQDALSKAISARTALFHPQQAPSAIGQLGTLLHLRKPQQATPSNTPGDMVNALSAGAPSGAQDDDKMAQVKKAYKEVFGADMPTDKAQQFFNHIYGGSALEPKPVKYSDYTSSLRRFVEAEGGDPDNPTAAQEQAFRDQRLKQATADRSTDTTRSTITTDPFGVSSTTTSKLHRGPAGATPMAVTATPNKATTPATPGELKKKVSAPAKTTGPKQLDAQGQIPADAKVNPQLREAANNLLNGMDVTKLPIPARDRSAAEALAKQYGWKGQGFFTPADMLRVRESTAILKQLGDSDSLSVLDDSVSRQKVAQVLQDAQKRGVIGQTLQNLAAGSLNQKEQQFVTLYNQAVGRISGLSNLVRSGRPTEATINRLKSELPDPFSTASSAHAKDKLKQLQSEIDIALDKGQFADQPTGGDSDDEFLKKF